MHHLRERDKTMPLFLYHKEKPRIRSPLSAHGDLIILC